MPRNLTYKAVVIAAVVLASVYYIIGIPKSKAELIENVRQNIRLGLDLQGGSHLVVQVQVQDAFKSEADTVMDRLKDELTKQGVSFGSMDRNDPKTLEEADSIQINIKGVPLDKTATLRQVVTERFPQWVLTGINATDYRL